MEKCAAIVIRDRKLLVVRKKDTSIFISPGGKVEPGESFEECLVRELREEIDIFPKLTKYFGTFNRKAAFDDRDITIHTWLVDFDGECSANSEIEEIRWIDGLSNIELGSVFSECVLPKLIERDLIDG